MSVNASDHMTPESKFQAAVLGYSNHIFFPDFAGNHVDPDIVISSTGYKTSGLGNNGGGVKDNFALLRLLRWARENGQYIYNPNAWNNMAVSKQITGKDNNWMYVMNSAVSRCKVMVQLLPFQDDGGDPETVGIELEMARKHGKPVVFLQGTVARMLEKTWGGMAKVPMQDAQHLSCIREYDYAFNMIGTAGGLECKSFVHASRSDKVVTQANVKEHYKLNITGSFLQWPKSPFYQNFDQSRQGMPFFSFYEGSVETAEEDQYKYEMSNFPGFAQFQTQRKKSGLGTLKRVDVIPYDECHEAAKRLALIGTQAGVIREDGTVAMWKGQAPNAKYHAIGS